jgi:hypothetical protein
VSTESTISPRKETVYDGPEIDLFKQRQPNATKPDTAKKETVHNGDVPDFITRKFSAQELKQVSKPQTETVHEGGIPEMFAKLGRIAHDLVMPDTETIYQGPESRVQNVIDIHHIETVQAAGESTEPAPIKETVFDETTFIAKKVDTSASRALVTRMVQRASVRFFAVAALSLLELYVCRDNLPVAISSGIMFISFSVVGFYTFKLNLKALLFAIGIYFLTTLFMASNAVMTERMFEMLVPLFSRCFMIYNLLRTYGLLVDLHLLEAENY